MTVVRVVWAGYTTYLRDPREIGVFLRGVECNEHGVAIRELCQDDAELVIHRGRITSMETIA